MNKIDFALVISAERCNPNGDPLMLNRPRIDREGYGYMSDVCLKHKIRNRFFDFGENVLMVGAGRTGKTESTKNRIDDNKKLKELRKKKDWEQFYREACTHWIDVRTFGQVFPFSDISGGTSGGIRGPVSIGEAFSLEPVDIIDVSITKEMNLEKTEGKDNTTMAEKYIIRKGAYVAYGSVFPQLAGMTGFSDEDAGKLKEAMRTIFENDASESRPSGSMSSTLYWWTHSCSCGDLNSAHVHRSLNIKPKEEWPYFTAEPEQLEKIRLEIH